MPKPPAWATRLLERVWAAEAYERADGEIVPVPDLAWRRGTSWSSSGHCSPQWWEGASRDAQPHHYASRIVVTAHASYARQWREREDGGSDQRMVLLHEIAHALRNLDNRRASHDQTFWRLAWHLYNTYGTGMRQRAVLAREGSYRATAKTVAAELGVKGAAPAVPRKRKEANVAKTATAPAGMKRCPGVPKMGLPAHDEPVVGFNANAAHPDGLARLCRRDRAKYTAWLKGQKATTAPGDEPAPDEPAAPAKSKAHLQVVPEPEMEYQLPPGETPAVTERRQAFERQLAALGTGTPEAEELLREYAKQDVEGRRLQQRLAKRAQRAAQKAKAVAVPA